MNFGMKERVSELRSVALAARRRCEDLLAATSEARVRLEALERERFDTTASVERLGALATETLAAREHLGVLQHAYNAATNAQTQADETWGKAATPRLETEYEHAKAALAAAVADALRTKIVQSAAAEVVRAGAAFHEAADAAPGMGAVTVSEDVGDAIRAALSSVKTEDRK